MVRHRTPEAKKLFALVIIEPMEKFRRGLLEAVGAALATEASETAVTSLSSLCWTRASKGTRRSGAEAVPRMSPSSRSRFHVRGIVCRPEATKYSEGYWSSWDVVISTI